MFVFILILTTFYFLFAVIWSTESLNKVFKAMWVVLMLYGALLISGAEGVTAGGYEVAHLVTKTTVVIFLVISALQTIWLGWIWSRRTWLNMLIKLVLWLFAFASIFYTAMALGFITIR